MEGNSWPHFNRCVNNNKVITHFREGFRPKGHHYSFLKSEHNDCALNLSDQRSERKIVIISRLLLGSRIYSLHNLDV